MQNVHKHVETRHEKKKKKKKKKIKTRNKKKKKKNINRLKIFITTSIRYGADNLQFYPSGKTTII